MSHYTNGMVEVPTEYHDLRVYKSSNGKIVIETHFDGETDNIIMDEWEAMVLGRLLCNPDGIQELRNLADEAIFQSLELPAAWVSELRGC